MPQTEFQNEKDAEQKNDDITSKQSNNQDHAPNDKGIQTTHDNAILTCANQSDPIYEQYTVLPIQSGRSMDSAIKLYQQKKVHDTPMPWYEKNLNMLCFQIFIRKAKMEYTKTDPNLFVIAIK